MNLAVVALLAGAVALLAVIAVVLVQLARGHALTVTSAGTDDEQVVALRAAIADLTLSATVARRSADRLDRATVDEHPS